MKTGCHRVKPVVDGVIMTDGRQWVLGCVDYERVALHHLVLLTSVKVCTRVNSCIGRNCHLCSPAYNITIFICAQGWVFCVPNICYWSVMPVNLDVQRPMESKQLLGYATSSHCLMQGCAAVVKRPVMYKLYCHEES